MANWLPHCGCNSALRGPEASLQYPHLPWSCCRWCSDRRLLPRRVGHWALQQHRYRSREKCATLSDPERSNCSLSCWCPCHLRRHSVRLSSRTDGLRQREYPLRRQSRVRAEVESAGFYQLSVFSRRMWWKNDLWSLFLVAHLELFCAKPAVGWICRCAVTFDWPCAERESSPSQWTLKRVHQGRMSRLPLKISVSVWSSFYNN